MKQGIIEAKFQKYYLVNIFNKMPHPFILWSLVILLINIILHIYARILIGNIFFSIFALFLVVKTYEKNISVINNFITENEFPEGSEPLIENLYKIHNFFFGKVQILWTFIIIIVRRLIAAYTTTEPFFNDYILNDTITMFFIISLILTFIGVTLCLYEISSHGIKVNDTFEFYYKYQNIYLQENSNAMLIGIFLLIYSIAVMSWGYMYNELQIGVIVSGLIILAIILNFLIGISGIRNGIRASKKIMLFKLSFEIITIKNKYASLVDSQDLSSLSDFSELTSILSNLSQRGRNIEQTKEWFFDIWPFISSFIIPLTYTVMRVIIEYYLRSAA